MLKHALIGAGLIACATFAASLGTDGVPPSPAQLRAVATWLSLNFDLPRVQTYPAVKLVSSVKITTLRHAGVFSARPEHVAAVPAGQREVVAAYDPLTRTIYLPQGWTGSTPAESSMLVHERVHHIQNIAQIRHACAQAGEELPYAAQQKWLGLFGRDLATDFDIDPFTLLVTTRCFN